MTHILFIRLELELDTKLSVIKVLVYSFKVAAHLNSTGID